MCVDERDGRQLKVFFHEFDLENMISPVNNNWNFYPYNQYGLSELCFFDIETTGLSQATSNIYLIGAGYYSDDKFKVVQWFADDYESEKDMLKEFISFVSSYKVLFQYNGNSFDIPYIKAKCKRYNVDCSVLEHIKHIDLYVALRKYSKILGLENKKLKSFEKYVGLEREDEFDGGALINVYVEYIHNSIMKKENEPLLHLLLLHNYEDITGLSCVAVLLFLKELGSMPVSFKKAELTDNDNMIIYYGGKFPYECSFRLEGDVRCCCKENEIYFEVPVRRGSLNYYFVDYKDYYYMIEEKTVMHKSVAMYTEPSVRRKAKKNECYVSNEGLYIPVNKPGCFSGTMHVFRESYTAKEYYIEVNEKLMENKAFFDTYFGQIIVGK